MGEPSYVSRGGLKLEHALDQFGVDCVDLICADLGSHVGGFVDCLLQRGAKRVYSIDTSYGTLAWKLRKDERVVVLERTNALHVELPESVELMTIDLGWTRQELILPRARRVLAEGGSIITLIKPQYEAGKEQLSSGVVPDERRSELASTEKVLLPGASITSGLTFLKTLLVLFGLLSGFGLVKNLLQYEGNNPTNVSYYFLFVILIQIVLILLVVFVSVLRKLGSADHLRQQVSLATELLKPVFTWFAEKAYASRLRLIPEGRRLEGRRLQMLVWRDRLTSRSGLYTQAIRWHLVAIVQWFGIAFNAAAILTFFVLIVFSDRAFGWQTTIEFASDTRVYELCRTLALPWSWLLGEGLGFPNPQQIAGSRIILHQSITDLSAEALHAWWPFLLLATVVYGLLPRVLLAVWTHRKVRTVSRTLIFNEYESDKLCRRLITPVFMEAPQEQNEQQEEVVPSPVQYQDVLEVAQKPSGQGQGESLILLSVDLEDTLNKQSLSEALTQRFGSMVQGCLIFGRSGADDLLTEEVIRSKKIAYLFLIDQDWNTPIPEDLDRMQKLISAAGELSLLAVLLTGTPTDGSPTAVDPENMQIWKQQIATLRQPRIGVQAVPALA